MEQPIRESVMDKIFGTDGITDANCTIDFVSRSEELKMSLGDKYSKFETYFEKKINRPLETICFRTM